MTAAGVAFQSMVDALGAAVIGQQHLAERLAIGLLANGHLLIEGAPGLAKTRAVKIFGFTGRRKL